MPNKHFFSVLLVYAFVFTIVLSADTYDSQDIHFLQEIKRYDILYFEKKWNAVDNHKKQLMIQQQRVTFSYLFSRFDISPKHQIEDFILLAKLSRATPISSPYQIKLLNFISRQKKEQRETYFNAIVNFLPEISTHSISYRIKEADKIYIAYNIDVLKCFFWSELIKLQIAGSKQTEPQKIIESILNLFKRLRILNIQITDAKVLIDKKNIELEIKLKKPVAKIILKNDKIFIEINQNPEIMEND